VGAERREFERRCDLSKHIAEAKKVDVMFDLVVNSESSSTSSPCFAVAAVPGTAASIQFTTSPEWP
jgi:hypothetical protein